MSVFITFEGIDGCGKTTVSKMVADILKANYTVGWTKEPTDQWSLITNVRNWQRNELANVELVSEEHKQRILAAMPAQTTPLQDALNFLLDRSFHAAEIKKALEEVDVLICDRYHDSTLAYQGAQLFDNSEQLKNSERVGNSDSLKPAASPELFNFSDMLELSAFIGQFPVPDLTILLDVTPTEADARRLKRDGQRRESKIPGYGPQDLQDAMERKTDLYAVRNRYLQLARNNKRFVVINANDRLYSVLANCLDTIGEVLNREEESDDK